MISRVVVESGGRVVGYKAARLQDYETTRPRDHLFLHFEVDRELISIDNRLDKRDRRFVDGKSGEGDLKNYLGKGDLRSRSPCRAGI